MAETLGAVQVELVPPAVDRVPPVHHIFVRSEAGTGELVTALCGHVVRPLGRRPGVAASRDECVVCVELARARGYQL